VGVRRIVWLFALIGCAASPNAPKPVPAASTSASTVVAKPPCASPKLVVEPRLEVKCWPKAPCWEHFEYAIDNCTDSPVALKVLLVKTKEDKHEDVVRLEFDPTVVVAPRTQKTFAYPPGPEHKRALVLGEHTLIAQVVRGESALMLEASFLVVDPELEKAKADCIERGDDWGSHGGFFAQVGCEPVMKDAGKDCHDERDCQGYCFLEKEEPISATEKRVFGKCTRLRLRFGCHTAIGKTNNGVMPLDRKFPHLCID